VAVHRVIAAATIPNKAIDAHIPPGTNAADHRIVRAVLAALPPKERQYVIWLRVPEDDIGANDLPNDALVVMYDNHLPPGTIDSAYASGHYVLYFGGNVQLDSNLIFGWNFRGYFSPVIQTFRTEVLRH